MDFARQQRNPARHLVGIGTVVLLHVLIGWALVSGLARKVVEVVKGPIEVKVIEEVIKKPPPPPEVVPPPPKLAAPPPPFIPPPEIAIAPPPTPAPTISVVTQEAPPAPQAPVIQRVPETPAPPAPPQPAIRSAQVACANYRDVMSSIQYPREALLDGIEGDVLIEFTVTASGQIRDPVIRKSTHRIFNRVSLNVVQRLECQAQGQDIRVQAPVSFRIR
jgi:protein TonB